MDKERTTRRGRLLIPYSQDGRVTYWLWHTRRYTLRFYLCHLIAQLCCIYHNISVRSGQDYGLTEFHLSVIIKISIKHSIEMSLQQHLRMCCKWRNIADVTIRVTAVTMRFFTFFSPRVTIRSAKRQSSERNTKL